MYRYETDTFVESGAGSAFAPSARVVFAGNTTGDTNTDDEAIIMRKAPEDEPDTPRLFVRGEGNDQIPQEFIDGLPLDKDNGYKYGAAGDIDGDRIDEIVIIRDNKIRWYKEANLNCRGDRRAGHHDEHAQRGHRRSRPGRHLHRSGPGRQPTADHPGCLPGHPRRMGHQRRHDQRAEHQHQREHPLPTCCLASRGSPLPP